MERERIPIGATVRCANCDQSWLVPGLRRGETHVCKGCGHRLLVGARAQRPSREMPSRGGRARASTRQAARYGS